VLGLPGGAPGFQGKPEPYQIAGNPRPFSTGKKCAHKTKLREEVVAGRPYIKFGESDEVIQ